MLVERDRAGSFEAAPELAILEVEDTTRALGDLAHGHRGEFRGPVLAISGSSGKTTTKDMAAAILSEEKPCLKTTGNLNNEYGLPLTLLKREARHESIVLELGMNHRGEIARLAEIAEPHIGLLTNVGTAHIEFLGSQENIALEKGDLFASLPEKGVAAINLEDPLVVSQAKRARCARLGYGFGEAADVRASNLRFSPSPSPEVRFDLTIESQTAEVRVHGLGETTARNALAAATLARAADVSLTRIVSGLANYRPPRGRMTALLVRPGITLIDDSYNANPESLEAALGTLAHLAKQGRSLAVLGDMNELGDHALEQHRAAGRRVQELGIDCLFTLGRFAAEMAHAARTAGMPASQISETEECEELIAELRKRATQGDWILVKGSRGMHMERVVEALVPEENR